MSMNGWDNAYPALYTTVEVPDVRKEIKDREVPYGWSRVEKYSKIVEDLIAIVFLLVDSLGVVAYQIAVLSLLATMLIGLWLIRPVSDRWSGSGELPTASPPPERLAPASAPIEPR
jgi:hypothetical protein